MKINIPKIKPTQGFQICPVCGGKTEYAGMQRMWIKEALHGYNEDIEKSMFGFPEKWRWFWKVILFVQVAGLIIQFIGLLIMIF